MTSWSRTRAEELVRGEDLMTTIRASGIDVHSDVTDWERSRNIVERYGVTEIITDEPAWVVRDRRANTAM